MTTLNDMAVSAFAALPLVEQSRLLAEHAAPVLPTRDTCGLCADIGRACLVHMDDAGWEAALRRVR